MVSLKIVFVWYVGLMLSSFLIASVWQRTNFPTTTPQTFGIHFYQHILGQIDGRSCPSYPVCSAYAREALQQHGWLVGSWLAMDRLIHEFDDLQSNHTIIVEGEKRLYDPLSRNDFWLRGL